MIKTREELITSLQSILGETPDDTGIELLENVSDTLSDYENRINENGDWKNRYEENDKNWRQKYTDRFLNNDPAEEEKREQEEYNMPTSFDDLFKEV